MKFLMGLMFVFSFSGFAQEAGDVIDCLGKNYSVVFDYPEITSRKPFDYFNSLFSSYDFDIFKRDGGSSDFNIDNLEANLVTGDGKFSVLVIKNGDLTFSYNKDLDTAFLSNKRNLNIDRFLCEVK